MLMSCPECNMLIWLAEAEEKNVYELFCDDCEKTWKITIKQMTEEIFFTIRFPKKGVEEE